MVLHPDKFNKHVQYAWRFDPCEIAPEGGTLVSPEQRQQRRARAREPVASPMMSSTSEGRQSRFDGFGLLVSATGLDPEPETYTIVLRMKSTVRTCRCLSCIVSDPNDHFGHYDVAMGIAWVTPIGEI
eukprot:2814872-Prymnesium_polylepis.1